MFLSRYSGVTSSLWKSRFMLDPFSIKLYSSVTKYTGISCNIQEQPSCTCYKKNRNEYLLSNKSYYLLPKRCYSKILDGDVSELQRINQERELKKLTQLFPQPRVTLNEFTTKTPHKTFDVHYKQHMVKKKKMAQGDWVCTYSFVWPEKMKFESTSLTKRQAAEKAATQALLWLYVNKRIDTKGQPVYDREVLNQLRDTVNQPIQITVNPKTVERIEKIWNDYETGIKPMYEEVFKEAANKKIKTPILSKDSTLDEADFSDEDIDLEEISDLSDPKPHIHPVYGKAVKTPAMSTLLRRKRALQRQFQLYDEELTALPIDAYADTITSTLEKSRVVVVVGAAGCGKSTRAPAAILRAGGIGTTAIVAEPRRVAAIGLAQRVASELGEEVGESIGYQVRLHSKPPKPPGGSILYCTSGVLLRRLHSNPGLHGCSHVIIDEAHERDVNTDITLLLLKRALNLNPGLKVVVMSATLDTAVFTRYFDSCPVVEVPGRTFPVEVFHLEDIQKKFGLSLSNTAENCKKVDSKPIVFCQEVVDVIRAVDSKQPEGAILVFLPGWAEIKATKQLLDEHYGDSTTHMILPVHSRLSTADQTKMFATPQPGVRKVVLSTNIAETSITIPDVVYVIDAGAHKENRLKEGTGTASLETVWVSQAAAKQRTGRAGRVQPGHCYRLYTKEKESEFSLHTTPEILRIPLEQTVLDCKTYAPEDKVEDFLSQLPEPPSKEVIKFAVNDLINLGALTPTEQLTRLGSLVSTLTLHPRLAAGLLQAAVAGTALSFANIATHCSSNVEVFKDAADRRDEIRELKSKYSKTSDHAALHFIQQEFEETARGGRDAVQLWCERHGLRKDRLGYVKSLSNLHLEQLLKSNFLGPSPDVDALTRFSDVEELAAAVLVLGSDGIMATRRQVRTKGKLATVNELVTSKGDRAHIGSESVNYGIAKRSTKPTLLAYYGGQHSAERRALVLYQTSVIPPHTALVFAGGDIHCETKADDDETTIMTLTRHNLTAHVPTSQAQALLKARDMWQQTFQYYIERDFEQISYDDHTNVSRFTTRLVKALGRLLVEAHSEYVLGKAKWEEEELR